MSDRIEIRGLRVVTRVGVSDEERATAQPLEIDLDLEVDLDAAARTDEVADTVDYGEVAIAVAAALGGVECALLERVAGLAAAAVLGHDERTAAVTVTVRKLRPPLPLDVATTGVRVRRARPS